MSTRHNVAVAAGTPSNFSYPGEIGYDFSVGASPISVTTLDAFVNPATPWATPKTVYLYADSSQAVVATVTIGTGEVAAGTATQIGQMVSKALASPVTLAAGTSYRVTAQDYTNDQAIHNSATGVSFDDGSGDITRNIAVYGGDGPIYPNETDGVGTPTNTPYVLAGFGYTVAGAVLSPSISVNPPTATTGQTVAITVTNNGPTWAAGTVLTLTGGTGASLSAPTPNLSANPQTIGATLNPGSAAGSLTIGDSADAATSAVVVSAPASVSGLTLTQGTIGPASIAFPFSGITGGTAPYSTQFYRSPASGFTPPSAGVALGSPVVGASGTLADPSPVAGSVSYYRAVTTDAAGGTVLSVEVPADPSLATIVVGSIGDSIQYGYVVPTGDDPLSQCMADLATRYGFREATAVDQAISGTTTTDWLPTGGYLPAAVAAIKAAGGTLVSLTLGTNNVKLSIATTPAQYHADLTAITGYIASQGLATVVHYPIFMDLTGSETLTAWGPASLTLLQQYQGQIDTLVNGTTIFQGDRLGFQYFADNRNLLQDGVHPSVAGDLALSRLQGNPIARALGLLASGTSAPAATSYSVFNYPTTPVAQAYSIAFLFNDPVSAAGSITLPATAGIAWGSGASGAAGAVAVASGATSAESEATFTAGAIPAVVLAHTGLGFTAGDPTLAAATATAPATGSGSGVTDASIKTDLAAELLAFFGANVIGVNVVEVNGFAAAVEPAGYNPQAATSNSIELSLSDPQATGNLAGWTVEILQGPGAGQAPAITSNDGTTLIATISGAFNPLPTTASLYCLHPPIQASRVIASVVASSVTAPVVASSVTAPVVASSVTAPVTLPVTAPDGYGSSGTTTLDPDTAAQITQIATDTSAIRPVTDSIAMQQVMGTVQQGSSNSVIICPTTFSTGDNQYQNQFMVFGNLPGSGTGSLFQGLVVPIASYKGSTRGATLDLTSCPFLAAGNNPPIDLPFTIVGSRS